MSKKDGKIKHAEELAKLLTEDELRQAVEAARNLPKPDEAPMISDNGHHEFREAESREVTIRDEAKINMTKHITKPEPGLRNVLPVTEVPGPLLMDIVEGTHIDEMLNPQRRREKAEESPEENEYELFCYAMKGFNRKGLKEYLQLGELEASEKTLGDGLTPEVRQ